MPHMDAYAKTTFDFDSIHSTRYSHRRSNWLSSSSVPSPKIVRVYWCGASYTASLPVQPHQHRPAARSATRYVAHDPGPTRAIDGSTKDARHWAIPHLGLIFAKSQSSRHCGSASSAKLPVVPFVSCQRTLIELVTRQ
jgi:hypothetical protein